MIVLRSPLRLYDVDLVGIALLAAALAGGYFGLLVPQAANSAEYARSVQATDQAQAQLDLKLLEFQALKRNIASLEVGVAERYENAPKVGDVNRIVNSLASIAKETEIAIDSIVPEQARRSDERFSSDIRIVANGRSVSFIKFLDEVSRAHPQHSIESMTIHIDKRADHTICALTLTLRFYFLPNDEAARESGP